MRARARALQGKVQGAQKLRVKAWAKVNLALDIVGKRPDGYHDIETVMHRIELADDIEVVRCGDRMTAGEPAIRVEVVGVAGMDVSGVPCDRATSHSERLRPFSNAWGVPSL